MNGHPKPIFSRIASFRALRLLLTAAVALGPLAAMPAPARADTVALRSPTGSPDASPNGFPTTSPSPTVTPVDTEDPTVAVTNPQPNADVSGAVAVDLSASDNVGVVRSELYVDGGLIATRNAPPFSFTWDSTSVSDGSHSIKTIVYDGTNRSGTSGSIPVNVGNFVQPKLVIVSPAIADSVTGVITVVVQYIGAIRPLASPSRLTLIVNGVTAVTVNNPVFTVNMPWDTTTAPAGPANLVAHLVDSAGVDLYSNGVRVTIVRGGAPPPATGVALTAPDDSATVYGPIPVTAEAWTTSGSISRVEFYAGSQLIGTDISPPYAITWDTWVMPTGFYDLTAKAYSSTGSATSTVHRIYVGRGPQGSPPTVTMVDPPEGALIGGTTHLSAYASDPDGPVSVTFYVDQVGPGNHSLGIINVPPFEQMWDTTHVGGSQIADGAHTIYAVADDRTGYSTVSDPHHVTIDNTSPNVTISSPGSGQTVSGIITISAIASDAHLSKVALLVDGNQVGGSLTSDPFNFSWDTRTVANGSHVVAVEALDRAGNTRTATITLTTNNIFDVTPPAVSIISPSEGTTAGGLLVVTASASDNIGVSRVDFLVDGAVLSSDATAPYSFPFDTVPVANGAHVLMARAYDAAGNHADSVSVNITVFNDHRPLSVTWVHPDPEGAVVGGPGIPMQISWTGSPHLVQFYVNGRLENTTFAPVNQAIYLPPAQDADFTLRATISNTQESASADRHVSYDVTAPTISAFNLHNSQILSGTVHVTGTAADTHPGTLEFDIAEDSSLTVDHVMATGAFNTLNWDWDTTTHPDGQLRIKMKAHDIVNNTREQFVDAYIDNLPPTYARVTPADNSNWPRGMTIPVEVNATDAGSGIKTVKISVDGYPALQMTQNNGTGPFRYAWINGGTWPYGRHNFTVTAEDWSGKQTIDNGYINLVHDTTPPTVAITAPIENVTVSGVLTHIIAVAQDNVHVSRHDFTITGPNGYSFTRSEYSDTADWYWNVSNVATGDYTISDRVLDDEANAATAVCHVHVILDHIAPVVSITSPANNAQVPAPVPMTMTVSATDNVAVTSVQIYAGQTNTLLRVASATSAPWTFIIDTSMLTGSTQIYRAVAYDAAGNATTSTPVTVHFSGTQGFQIHLLNVRDGWSYAGTINVGSIWPGLPSAVTPTLSALFIDGFEAYALPGQVQIPVDLRRYAEGPHTLRWEGVVGNGTFSSESVTINVDNTGVAPNYAPNTEVMIPGAGGFMGGINYNASVYANAPRYPFTPSVLAKIDGATAGATQYPSSGGPNILVPIKTTLIPNGQHSFNAESYAGDYPTLVAHTTPIPVNIDNTIRLTEPSYDGRIYAGQGAVIIPFTAHLYYPQQYATVEFWAETYTGAKELLSRQTVRVGVSDYGATLTISQNSAGRYTSVWTYALRQGQTTPLPLDRDVRYFNVAFSIGGGGGGRFSVPARPASAAIEGDFAAPGVTIMAEADAIRLSQAGESGALSNPDLIVPFRVIFASARSATAVTAVEITGMGDRAKLDATGGEGLGEFTVGPRPNGSSFFVFNAAGLSVNPADLQILKKVGNATEPVALAWFGAQGVGSLGEGTYMVSAAPSSARRAAAPVSVKVGGNPSAHPVLKVLADSDVRINIFNMAGELVVQQRASPGALDGGDHGVLYVVDLPSDAYIARITDAGGQTATAKLLVVR